MSNVQWIVVDDTDPRISYSGTWSTQGQATLKDMGQFGAPFLLTSHGTTINASLSFSFSGTQLVVAGSQLIPNDSNSFGGSCTVDGITKSIVYTTENATNRVALCRFDSLTDNRHTLVVNAVPTGHKPFWFDYLRYLPTPDIPTTDEYVQVLTDNGSLFFDASWANEAPESVPQVSTNTANAMMSYTFVGTSIAWYGSYNHSTSLRPENLSYKIDQGDPNIVNILPSTKVVDDITMQQVLFNASGLSPGIIHDLKVTYLGNSQSVPLSLNNLVITWGPLLSLGPNSSGAIPSTSGLPTNSPSNPSSLPDHQNSRTLHIAVAVSIVGAAIVLGSIALFFITRRRRQRASNSKTIDVTQDISPRPFIASNATSSYNTQTNRRNSQGSAPAAFVPASKARAAQATQVLPASSPAETASPTSSNPNVSPDGTAAYLRNLLLRHPPALSVRPIQSHENSAGSSNFAREENDSALPPAYGI